MITQATVHPCDALGDQRFSDVQASITCSIGMRLAGYYAIALTEVGIYSTDWTGMAAGSQVGFNWDMLSDPDSETSGDEGSISPGRLDPPSNDNSVALLNVDNENLGVMRNMGKPLIFLCQDFVAYHAVLQSELGAYKRYSFSPNYHTNMRVFAQLVSGSGTPAGDVTMWCCFKTWTRKDAASYDWHGFNDSYSDS